MVDLKEMEVGSLWSVETVAGLVPVEVLGVESWIAVQCLDLMSGDRFLTSSGWFRERLEKVTVASGREFLVPVGHKVFELPASHCEHGVALSEGCVLCREAMGGA